MKVEVADDIDDDPRVEMTRICSIVSPNLDPRVSANPDLVLSINRRSELFRVAEIRVNSMEDFKLIKLTVEGSMESGVTIEARFKEFCKVLFVFIYKVSLKLFVIFFGLVNLALGLIICVV
ncbi:hypothetical protein HanIR_Chr17g0893031 [Helianthus annuus]|nr:hypothetical protein HanIR_Chr17g0893031 [Helianthus annuus]